MNVNESSNAIDIGIHTNIFDGRKNTDVFDSDQFTVCGKVHILKTHFELNNEMYPKR